MVVLMVAACAACCAVLCAAVVVRIAARRQPAQSHHPTPVAQREEDRVRPAIDQAGAPIWVDHDELFWHEIVCWPTRIDGARSDRRDAG
jgi:hypothetical protein